MWVRGSNDKLFYMTLCDGSLKQTNFSFPNFSYFPNLSESVLETVDRACRYRVDVYCTHCIFAVLSVFNGVFCGFSAGFHRFCMFFGNILARIHRQRSPSEPAVPRYTQGPRAVRGSVHKRPDQDFGQISSLDRGF